MKKFFLVCLLAWVAIVGLGLAERNFELKAVRAEKGNVQELRRLYQEALSLARNKEHAKSNETYEQILGQLPQKGRFDPHRKQIFYSMAGNYAKLGKKETSFEFLERAVHAGFWDAKFIDADDDFASLREDSEYKRLVEEARLALFHLVFSLKDVHGKTLKQEDFDGKVLVLDLWATWCPPCIRELPDLVALQKKYGKNGLQVIGLTCERLPPEGVTEQVVGRVRTFTEAKHLNYPIVVLSTEEQAALSVRHLPTKIFVDRKMNIRARESGGRGYAHFEAKVLPLLQEKVDL